jgi:hypothetical protein
VPASKAPAAARGTSAVTVVGGVALLVGSAVVAICAGLVSRSHVTVPWGLFLGVAGSVSLIVVTRVSAGRRPGYLAAGGWLLGVGAVLFWHPGGDYLFADDGLGYGFLLGATIAVLVAAGWGGPSPDTSQQAPRPRRS